MAERAAAMRTQKYPFDFPLEERFARLEALRADANPGILRADQDGNHYLIIDERPVARVLAPAQTPGEEEVLREAVTVMEFADAEERARFVRNECPWCAPPGSGAGVAVPAGLAGALRDARHVAVMTGAGISAESGIPTFRGTRLGLWARYDPMRMASVEGFERNPRLSWAWYSWRRELVAAAQPAAGHRALAQQQEMVPRLTLITQNVDDLHERAGSRDVLHLHGSIFETRCFDEGRLLSDAEVDTSVFPPRCPCDAYARPGVVWFGEPLPRDAFHAAEAALADCDVCLIVGTSANVHPAAGLVDYLRPDAVRVVVNVETTDHAEEADYVILAPAGQVLPALVRGLE